MAILNITLPEGAVVCNGKQVTFRAPCDCVGVTGIAIEGVTYALLDTTDAPVNSISAFVTGALVTVVLDTENNKAYIQNGSAAAAGVPRRVAVKLLASGWDSENSQIVDVLGLSIDETEQLVHIFPANNVVYAESGIVAETYEAGKLKFTAETIPTVDLDISIIIEELGTQNPDAPSNVEFVAVDLPISSTVPTSHDVWVDPEDDGTVEVASNAVIKYKDPVTGDIKKIGGGGSGILISEEIPDNVEVWIDPDEEDQTDNFYTMAQSDARFAGIDLSNVSNEDMLAKMQASGYSLPGNIGEYYSATGTVASVYKGYTEIASLTVPAGTYLFIAYTEISIDAADTVINASFNFGNTSPSGWTCGAVRTTGAGGGGAVSVGLGVNEIDNITATLTGYGGKNATYNYIGKILAVRLA